MKTTIFSLAIMLALLTSCGKQSSDYKALKLQNDSLLQVKNQMETEVDDYFSAMNQIQENIEKIKGTEHVISLQPAGKELSDDKRKQIKEDMAYLAELLQTNKDELARLKTKLKSSSFKFTELERNIARLTKSLEEETTRVNELQVQLGEKDIVIGKLGTTVSKQGKDLEVLATDVKAKETKISEQDATIHTAWYVFGTKKELKEQKIITDAGLFSAQKILQRDFNKNYFVRIDARQTKSIPLYSTHAKMLTTHPKSSYTLEKVNNNFVLQITNPTEFWSVSKYLVIEVD